MSWDQFCVFWQCSAAYSVLFGWKLAYRGLTGESVDSVIASQAISLLLLTMLQFLVPAAHLNPVGAWMELTSRARSFASALSSTLSSFAASAAVVQLFQATLPALKWDNIAVPHTRIQSGDIFLHIVLAEAVVSLACVLFAQQLIKAAATAVPALGSIPSFVILNAYLLLQLQTPLMAHLGNVNPASAFASLFFHQQPIITIAQISGNIFAVVVHSYANHLISNRAPLKEKQE